MIFQKRFRNCRAVGIAGEVKIREPEEPDEFSQYALDIYVKFDRARSYMRSIRIDNLRRTR